SAPPPPASDPARARGGAACPVGGVGVARGVVSRARGLRHVRDRLRRSPGPDPDPHARRLGGTPAAQGLQRRSRPGPVQGEQEGDMTETRDYESKTVDLWASGTEELPFDPTDEGRQEMGPYDTPERLREQFGRVIADDYMYEEEGL